MPRSALVVIALCVVASLLGMRVHRATATDEPSISSEVRAATLTFAPGVAPGDRAWILNAIATARPEAQRLIAEVDGMVEVRTDLNAPGASYGPGTEQAIGMTAMKGNQALITLDVRELDGERAIDRNMVVLHEFGHVIDYVLADDALVNSLDARELEGEGALDRNVVVLHEFGHGIDYVLPDAALVNSRDAAIPPAGTCN